MNKKRIVVFGLGNLYRMFLKYYDDQRAEIIAVCDNNRMVLENVVSQPTVLPNEIADMEFDYIVVTSNYYRDIAAQLQEYGIKSTRILDFGSICADASILSNLELVGLLRVDLLQAVKSDKKFEKIRETEEKQLFLSARILINEMKSKKIDSLEEVEFRVYSQFGEDGIIQWLIHNVMIENKTFIEFGVEDYMESNTRFLMMNNNWSGFVMDGNDRNIERLKNWKFFWRYDLEARTAFITRDNINQLISEAGYIGDVGILSIDLDGNDYWILNAIHCVTPRILICEYNNIYGAEKKVSIPYDNDFVRTKAHYSNLYWGGALPAFIDWAEKNDYYYMGSNSAGNNAFFVRKDCIAFDKIPHKAQVFIESKYRESRDKNGNLTYIRGSKRLASIKEMQLIDIDTGVLDTIQNIYGL